jgi:hypothetical protein
LLLGGHGRPLGRSEKFELNAVILGSDGNALKKYRLAIDRDTPQPMKLSISFPGELVNANQPLTFMLSTSTCYNPKTSGTNLDSRFLGVNLLQINFE